MSSSQGDNSTVAGNSTASDASNSCGSVTNQIDLLGLRVGSLFVIMFTSMLGALFPVLSRRSKLITIPPLVFEYVPCPYRFPAYIQCSIITALQSTLGPGSSYVYSLGLQCILS